ncbi:hypothetical protein [Burkholderia vietnamiensis]|uniref:hypothetical protein n=1 Tax=Burkholderia vietnamiensis TaxID=60552 RepID=UPI0015944BA9|nr:hypothetical protein [Burkholderia vietnamiensis]
MQSQPHKGKKGRTRQARPWAAATRSKQARDRVRAQRKTRHLTPALRDMLATWDVAQHEARAHYEAHCEAYREEGRLNLVGDAPESSPSPAWQAVIDGLTETE